MGDGCKTAKAFGVIGLLTNIVVIVAVLANFKLIPFFPARARMASIVSILTTGKSDGRGGRPDMTAHPFHLEV